MIEDGWDPATRAPRIQRINLLRAAVFLLAVAALVYLALSHREAITATYDYLVYLAFVLLTSFEVDSTNRLRVLRLQESLSAHNNRGET